MFNLWRNLCASTPIQNMPVAEGLSMEIDSLLESCDIRSLEGAKLQDAWNFLTKLKQNKKHAEEVRRIALQLFEQLREYHQCGDSERFYLECAAILHDIGYAINSKKHHKHSLRLILQAKLPSITEREKLIVANIARYHRRSMPKATHTPYAELSLDEQMIVKKMAALLRLADSLVRAEKVRINRLEIQIPNGHCEFIIESKEECKEEIQSFLKRKDLFTQTFGREALIVKK